MSKSSLVAHVECVPEDQSFHHTHMESLLMQFFLIFQAVFIMKLPSHSQLLGYSSVWLSSSCAVFM